MDDSRRWFHRTTHTYGAWLYGDPRGFRTRHHREHVEGDYKNPPPAGTYDWQYARSQRLLKQEPVVLSQEWRPVIGAAPRDRLRELGAELLSISVSGQHVHFQTRMPPSCPREWTGIAKKHAWFIARDNGWVGMLWAKRSKANPIKDRKHQENVFRLLCRNPLEDGSVLPPLRGSNAKTRISTPGISTEHVSIHSESHEGRRLGLALPDGSSRAKPTRRGGWALSSLTR